MEGSDELLGIIMAGGRGTRLMPLTENRPKPMVPVLGRPVIDYVKESGAAMILVEHNTERAIQLSNRIFRLVEGKLVEQFFQGGEEE